MPLYLLDTSKHNVTRLPPRNSVFSRGENLQEVMTASQRVIAGPDSLAASDYPTPDMVRLCGALTPGKPALHNGERAEVARWLWRAFESVAPPFPTTAPNEAPAESGHFLWLQSDLRESSPLEADPSVRALFAALRETPGLTVAAAQAAGHSTIALAAALSHGWVVNTPRKLPPVGYTRRATPPPVPSAQGELSL
jgi:hypothetical protein